MIIPTFYPNISWESLRALLQSSLLILSLAAIAPFVMAADSQPIVVELATDQALLPLYLGRPIRESCQFDPAYLDKLDRVLLNDLGGNGMNCLMERSCENHRLLSDLPLDDSAAASRWRSLGAAYVVKAIYSRQGVKAQLLMVAKRSVTVTATLSLTGNLGEDRRQIHRLADAIHRAFFGVEGIASTRLLYAYRYKTGEGASAEWKSEIWEMDWDGANERKLSSGDVGYAISPVYIPPKASCQSAAFFYVSYLNGQPKIYIGTFKGGRPMRFSSLRGNQLMPAISRQRDQVAFISDVTGNPDLFLQPFSCETGAVGKPRQIFTARQATQGSPAFSPDGQKIAFVSNKDGHTRVYVIKIPPAGAKLADVKARLISHANRESSAPSWSPDGSKLAYCARQSGARQIWVYDFESDKEWQLTEGVGDKENPSWAPNSVHLAYNTTGKIGSDLYIINLFQKKPIKITTGPGEKRFPNWEVRM